MELHRLKLHSVHKDIHRGTFTEEHILSRFGGMSGLKLAATGEQGDLNITDHDMRYAPFYLSKK